MLRANERYNLCLSRKQLNQMAKEAFREVGTRIQDRRHLDLVYNFGSHLTDFYKPGKGRRTCWGGGNGSSVYMFILPLGPVSHRIIILRSRLLVCDSNVLRPSVATDPALSDSSLLRKLRSNREVAVSRLEDVISKYAVRQEDTEELERKKRQEKKEKGVGLRPPSSTSSSL